MRVEPHCFQVYLWERCEESLKFYHEVVVWRDDVKEVFDDADVVVCPALVRSRIYPGAGHSRHIIRNDCIDLIPHASVVAAGVSRQCYYVLTTAARNATSIFSISLNSNTLSFLSKR